MSAPQATQKTSPITWIGIIAIRGYQLVLSPLWPGSCRFEPSCSHYAMDALKTHGALKGICLSLWRIIRCNPWNGGGYEPVPKPHQHTHCSHRDGHDPTHQAIPATSPKLTQG